MGSWPGDHTALCWLVAPAACAGAGRFPGVVLGDHYSTKCPGIWVDDGVCKAGADSMRTAGPAYLQQCWGLTLQVVVHVFVHLLWGVHHAYASERLRTKLDCNLDWRQIVVAHSVSGQDPLLCACEQVSSAHHAMTGQRREAPSFTLFPCCSVRGAPCLHAPREFAAEDPAGNRAAKDMMPCISSSKAGAIPAATPCSAPRLCFLVWRHFSAGQQTEQREQLPATLTPQSP